MLGIGIAKRLANWNWFKPTKTKLTLLGESDKMSITILHLMAQIKTGATKYYHHILYKKHSHVPMVIKIKDHRECYISV